MAFAASAVPPLPLPAPASPDGPRARALGVQSTQSLLHPLSIPTPSLPHFLSITTPSPFYPHSNPIPSPLHPPSILTSYLLHPLSILIPISFHPLSIPSPSPLYPHWDCSITMPCPVHAAVLHRTWGSAGEPRPRHEKAALVFPPCVIAAQYQLKTFHLKMQMKAGVPAQTEGGSGGEGSALLISLSHSVGNLN